MSSPSETDPPVAASRSYGCFISYVPEDNQQVGRRWATWLQYQVIEKFKVPPGLIGAKNSRGETIPDRIWPSFAEDVDPASPELSAVIRRALEESRMLVVICSPRAARSVQVAAQIRYFKQMGLGDSIFAVVIDGELEASESPDGRGCFPLPLLHPVDAHGQLQLDREEFPLAFDFRLTDGSQGWTSSEVYRDTGAGDAKVSAYAELCEKTKLRALGAVLGVEANEVQGRLTLRAPVVVKPAAPEPQSDFVFISYAREDQAAVKRISAQIETAGIPVWFDRGDVFDGDERGRRIHDKIRQCSLFLPVLSNTTHARTEGTFLQEWNWAEDQAERSYHNDVFILPLLVDDSSVPTRFGSFHHFACPDGELTSDLLDRVRSLLTDRAKQKNASIRPSAKPSDTRMIALSSEPAPPKVEVPLPEVPIKNDDIVYDENVQFTVYRPKVVLPGKWHTMLAFAHLAEKAADAPADAPDPVQEVVRQAKQVLGSMDAYRESTQDSTQAIPREGEITMVPEVEGIKFNPPRRSFLWDEPVHREEFRLMTKDAAIDAPKTLRGRMTIFLSSLIIAEISLVFRVDTAQEPASAQPTEAAHARPYRKVFASYSHRDMAVVEHIEHYARALGDTYLRDIVHLKSGEQWNPRLLEMIDEADVFQLFWSTNSMRSPYVKQEWEYALTLNRPNFIRPTFWEDPLPELPGQGLPPETLRALHFQRIESARLPTSAPIEADDVVVPRSANAAAPVMAATPSTPPPASAKRPSASAPAMSSAPAPGGTRRGGFGWQKIVAVVAVVAVVGGVGVHQYRGTSRGDAFASNDATAAAAMPTPSASPNDQTAATPQPTASPNDNSLASAPPPTATAPDANPQASGASDSSAERDTTPADWEDLVVKILEVAVLLVVLFAIGYVMWRRHRRH
jgi:hypothetical protein